MPSSVRPAQEGGADERGYGSGGLFLVCGVLAFLIAPSTSNPGFSDGAAALAFISSAAVAIERLIEGFFAAVAGPLGQWWPFNLARSEFDRFETETNSLLGPVLEKTIEELTAAKGVAGKSAEEIARIQGVIDGLNTEATRLSSRYEEVRTKLAPGSARLARVGEINAQAMTILAAAHANESNGVTAAKGLLTAAAEGADRATLILSSLQDNPARRIASLIMGASLGMLLAAGVGLNVFVAVFGSAHGNVPAALFGTIGIVLTGVVIGLGSGPTHEVVKSLQTYRDNRQVPETVTTPTTTPTGGGAEAAAVTDQMITRRFVRRTD